MDGSVYKKLFLNQSNAKSIPTFDLKHLKDQKTIVDCQAFHEVTQEDQKAT